MSSLWLIRHPAVLDMTGRCYGQLDVEVDPDVLRTAIETLRSTLPDWPVYASPASRCMKLAQALSPDVVCMDSLLELDFGAWEGLHWEDIPRSELDAWAEDILNGVPGGGERVADMIHRVSTAISEIAAAHPHGAIIITHAGPIRSLMFQAGLSNASDRWQVPVPFATPILIDWISE
ncbi:histidine phosphatase family protein [Burkholderiaceae bacterium DAT-1]|nr:histidine phosphatase family protein [Burkholderiaceae bacterium DAT-1]